MKIVLENYLVIVSVIILLYFLYRMIIEVEISKENKGQKYKYEITFYIKNNQSIKLILYSKHLYTSITGMEINGYIRSSKNTYLLEYRGKEILINKSSIVYIEFLRKNNE